MSYPIPQSTAGTMSGTVFDAAGQRVDLSVATEVQLGIEPVTPASGATARSWTR